MRFSDEVADQLEAYVYRLIDPRNGETFYIGKGRGNRVFQHVQDTLLLSNYEDTSSEKLSIIRKIRNEGLEVLHIIHRHGLSDQAAIEVESALIDAYPGLTNVASGIGAADRGTMSSQQIIFKYALPKLADNPSEKLVLININNIHDRSNTQSIYNQVQFAWRIDKERASKADYLVAVYKGISIGIFEVDDWLPATSENFPGRLSVAGRFGFVGRPADRVWNKFVGCRGKRIINREMKHVQYPIRYWNI